MIFKCRNCGGNTVYSPEKGKMYCPHCEGVDSGERVGEGSLVQCVNCGAPLEITQYTSACRCGHCGTYLILDERVEGAFEPQLILPFCIGKEAAVASMEKEFSRRLFAPADFLSAKSLERMEGIYVPFWLYDYGADYDFEGEGTRVRTWQSGDTEYTETSYFEVIRRMDVDFAQIPVDASIAMDDGIMDLMEPYSYGALTNFSPQYMSGFYGEVYNQGAEELDERAQAKARQASEELMQGSLTGYTTVRPLRKNLKLNREKFSYALMPVWQYVYHYRGQSYLYHVNGQTGKVIGATPVSKGKVMAYGTSVFAAVTALCFMATHLLEIL